ncbi:MAG: type II secretion system protein [Candidatus Shapirobacteria bacterium]|nr:type II secretion system protein [Candidatus Shapirobacteria bacterium]
MSMESSNKKAFTLVELLVSIAIIATLTAILLPNFMGARERAKDAQKEQDMGAIKSALRLYYNDKQAYPTPVGTGGSLASTFSTYMSAVTNLGYGYTYEQTNSGDGFLLKVGLDSGQGDDDINSQSRCGIGDTVDKLYVVCAN